jgi:hypothetical protein
MCLNLSGHGSHYHVTGDWKLRWSLCLPPCWRMLRYCLPTWFNLQSRGVQCPSACVASNNDLEDEMHMFMHCKFATDCLREASLWGKQETHMTSSGSFAYIMFTILATLDVEDRSRFVAILWSIWRARNACLWEQKSVNAKASCVLYLDTVRDYMWCNNLNVDAQTVDRTWAKLPTEWS